MALRRTQNKGHLIPYTKGPPYGGTHLSQYSYVMRLTSVSNPKTRMHPGWSAPIG